MCFTPLRRAPFRHLNFQMVREWCGLYIFYLEICFVPERRALFRHLNFETWSEHGGFCAFWLLNVLRAATRALFRHLNFEKCSEHNVFCTFWLSTGLRATTACTYSTAQLRKVLRTVFHLQMCLLRATTACNFSSLIWPDGSAPAALASLLFDPPEPHIIGKTVFRDFPTLSRTCIFFLLTLSLLWSSLFCPSPLWLFQPLLFHLSILSEVWL